MPDSRYESFKFLDITVDAKIATITMNRPEVLNSVDGEAHRELSRVLRVMSSDDRFRAVVVTGAGRAFSVGGDLNHLLDIHSDAAGMLTHFNLGRELVQSHIDFDRPVIAAINGYAMGAGLAFALLCDYIVIERSAQIADGHIRAALAAGDGGAMIWPLSVGLTRAKKYLLTGDWITADEAERIGLVSELVDDGGSLTRALSVANRLANGPAGAISATKRSLNQWLKLGQLAAFDLSLALEVVTSAHPDVRAAIESLQHGGPGAIPRDEP